METRTAQRQEIPRVVEIVDAAIRRPGGTTSAADDFPLALSEQNHDGIYVCEEAGDIAACLVTLCRDLRTSLGPVPTAMIGSVVTRPEFRGRGLSRTLQERALDDLKTRAALAVLWTEEPAYYEKRGFRAAGIEYHVSLGRWRPEATLDADQTLRVVRPGDFPKVEALFASHPFATERGPGDSAKLYGMPGTVGFVVETPGEVLAYAFVGKGADFPAWIHEWGGETDAVLRLVAMLVSRGIATHMLVPQGREAVASRLRAEGGESGTHPSGLWTVLDGARLRDIAGASSGLPAADAPASAWLGAVSANGEKLVGPCKAAIWGFDSV